ncbi:MAG TPA: 50S ribosomal protein L30 [Terriglobia bacterium]|nr:50S ribosomal protein L30 [Terriglobia bacterium]
MAGKTQARIRVRWIRSGIAFNRNQREAIRGLGLRRLHQVVECDDSPVVRGLIAKVAHLVEVLALAGSKPRTAGPEYTILPASAGPETAQATKVDDAGAASAEAIEPTADVTVASESTAQAEEAASGPKRRASRKAVTQTPEEPEPVAGQPAENTGS